MTTKRTPAGVALLLAAIIPGAAFAQSTYPDHPVKIIAPFAAGGPSDLIGRLLADKLTTSLRQRFMSKITPAPAAISA